ncbi:phosphate acyltransferase PlsX [Francisellaceae bacterium]|nr:phosphate acyltransferase PlsX [Francisellaceae bacterium]
MSQLIKVSVDAMGGDHGLKTTIPAAVKALKKHKMLHITLVGDKPAIEQTLITFSGKYDKARLDTIHTTQVVEMCELPSLALRNKKDSSMRVAINLVKDGVVSACVSAGNTGALMATSKFVLKTLPEIDRPAIVSAMPAMDPDTGEMRSVLMLDLGANVGCSSEQLFQFGVMGSVLATCLTGNPRPKVALLNIGEEEMKGLDSIKQASKMFHACDDINYHGYVEGSDINKGTVDVIVCDGFVGNISLKSCEGIASFIGRVMKASFKEGIFSRLAMIFAAPVLLKVKNKLDVRRYNGASLLGLRGIVIKSHGGVDAEAFITAIEVAMHEVEKDIPNKIQLQVEKLMQHPEV